ncbi:hypothetical protein SAY86_017323 [Trapa natans]|uniref:TORTIFOLIA1/SINE1-2 N-terminal domain-containing protein n=1 Tax=Trapa natans TaxID=22666 RepID=A0AAN7LRU8_TRANT|nr:hypothetical protein SAY86_017323 [Trapa natans]
MFPVCSGRVMGPDLSQVLCKELANFSKDADSRKSAMKALESYVKEMDSKSIPLFLSQLSEVLQSGDSSAEYITSLYDVLLRVHGVDVVPHIDNIMGTIVKTLSSSRGSSFTLHQSCSKVVTSTARYCIRPMMAEVRKNQIIHSICNPLCELLLASQESLSTGAALCLKALVDSDGWQFASDAMVNKVSLNVSVVLEMESNQTNAHMGLVMALAKKNSLILEAYARVLIGSGLMVLNAGAKQISSHKRLSAIQMVNFLMKSLDPRSIYSELDLIIEEMEKYESDDVAFVKGAAGEALQTARRILTQKERKSDMGSTPNPNSKLVHQFSTQWRNSSGFVSQSPESRTLDSLSKPGPPAGLLNSPSQASTDLQFVNQIVRQTVQRFEDRVANVSPKDSPTPVSQEKGEDEEKSSIAAVPQDLPLSTIQISSRSNSESLSEKHTGMFTSSPSSESGWSQTESNDYHLAYPVSCKDDAAGHEDKRMKIRAEVKMQRSSFILICSTLFLLLALIISPLYTDGNKNFGGSIPT